MALLNEDELRSKDLEAAYSGTTAKIDGWKSVRRVTALVIDILRRANNFFVTGPRGFQAIGIDPAKFSDIISPKSKGFDPSKAGAIIPKIAEVAALLSCSKVELYDCDEDLKNLDRLRRDIMEERDMNEILAIMPQIQDEFTKVNRSSATAPDEDSDDATELAPNTAKKKRVPPSLRAM